MLRPGGKSSNAGGESSAVMDLVRNDIFDRAVGGGEDVETLMNSVVGA